ncbi:hypothetical protein [Bremerella cremea]|uniref:hypothetical protein n=1 Tax=Bremerella cremea TaxID=1031537 RepID=UPI0013147E58|nr:hypothetical protein [Bremerella cremea]
MKYVTYFMMLVALSAAIGCGGSSKAPSGELTPDAQAQIEANDQEVHDAESAMQKGKK